MNSDIPKVSVVIPAYNCQDYIAATIESIFSQTYNDYEIIVVDDGSADGTARVISGFSDKIKYVYQSNAGPAAARNTGILKARGEYIAFLDHDDVWLPDKLKMQVELLSRNASLGLVFTDTYIVEDKLFLSPVAGSLFTFQLRPPHRGKVLKELFIDNFIPTPSVMARRDCFDKAGMFNPALVPIEDYDMWLHIAAFYEVDFIDVPLVKYRSRVACFRKNRILTASNTIKTLTGILSEYPYLKEALGGKVNRRFSQLYLFLARFYFSSYDFKEAFRNLYLSIKGNKY